MPTYLRNVESGELRTVEPESQEYADLKGERYDHGDGRQFPKWEVTGQHHVEELAHRSEEHALREEDLGYEHKPLPAVVNSSEAASPEAAPWRHLTPGETVGELEDGSRGSGFASIEEKEKQLLDDRGREASESRQKTFAEASERISHPAQKRQAARPKQEKADA